MVSYAFCQNNGRFAVAQKPTVLRCPMVILRDKNAIDWFRTAFAVSYWVCDENEPHRDSNENELELVHSVDFDLPGDAPSSWKALTV